VRGHRERYGSAILRWTRQAAFEAKDVTENEGGWSRGVADAKRAACGAGIGRESRAHGTPSPMWRCRGDLPVERGEKVGFGCVSVEEYVVASAGTGEFDDGKEFRGPFPVVGEFIDVLRSVCASTSRTVSCKRSRRRKC
jgi:hypothetical protein